MALKAPTRSSFNSSGNETAPALCAAEVSSLTPEFKALLQRVNKLEDEVKELREKTGLDKPEGRVDHKESVDASFKDSAPLSARRTRSAGSL